MMEIFVGRDAATSALCITIDAKPARVGLQGSVPQTVSRRHISLTANADGTYHLKNLQLQNTTFVNGLSVESRTVSTKDEIRLGTDRWLFDWQLLLQILPKEADIRPLRDVWNGYERAQFDIQVKQGRINALRSGLGILTMGGMVFGVVNRNAEAATDNTFLVYIYVLALILSAFFFVKSFIDAEKLPAKRKKMTEEFQKKYVCPNCGHFMGNVSYEILQQGNACPYCKARYKK